MLLQVENLHFQFTTSKKILDGASFALETGKVYALMGSNGAGKTTLFHLLSGFLQPQSGSIRFGGKETMGWPPYRLNRLGISRTFQDLRLVTKLTVKENIKLAMQGNGSDKWYNALLPDAFFKQANAAMERKAATVLEQCFLTDVQDSLAGEISYGQQKLTNLACCIANDSRLLLLDEPVAGINPSYRDLMALLLSELKKQDKTILLIEHNTDFIEKIADQLFFMHDGQLAAFADLAALRKDERVMEAYS